MQEKFKQFLYRFLWWNLILDIATVAYLLYVRSLFPDIEKGLSFAFATGLIFIATCLRVLYIFILLIIKLARKGYVEALCLVAELALLIIVLAWMFKALAFVFAGAASAAGH